MDRARFQDWVSSIDELTATQRREAPAARCPGASRAASAGERVRGAVHIQTVNSRHSQIKDFLRRFRGIATKCLDSYLRWFHLVVLGRHPSPRACLAAASARSCLRKTIENVVVHMAAVVHAPRRDLFMKCYQAGRIPHLVRNLPTKGKTCSWTDFFGCQSSKSNSTSGIEIKGTTLSFAWGLRRMSA